MSIDNEINKLIDNYVQEQNEEEENKKKEVDNYGEFLKKFSEIVNTVIVPVFEDIKTTLESKKIRCEIKINDGLNVKKVNLGIYPFIDTSSAQNHHPAITFFTEKPDKVVLYMQKMMQSGGSMGREGEFRLGDITDTFVKEKILELLQFCFGKKYY